MTCSKNYLLLAFKRQMKFSICDIHCFFAMICLASFAGKLSRKSSFNIIAGELSYIYIRCIGVMIAILNHYFCERIIAKWASSTRRIGNGSSSLIMRYNVQHLGRIFGKISYFNMERSVRSIINNLIDKKFTAFNHYLFAINSVRNKYVPISWLTIA